MTLAEFALLVERMRAKQREYFKTRKPSILNECRDYERRVDAAAKEILHPDSPGMFE